MSNGITAVLAVLVLAAVIAACVGYRRVKRRIAGFSRAAFGTDSLFEGLERQTKELAETPKSVAGMTRIFQPQIQRDFPDFHLEQFRDKAEHALTMALQAISAGDAACLNAAMEDETAAISETFAGQVENRIRENKAEGITERFAQIRIHQTEIANYVKRQGTCVITFQSAVGYIHYKEKDGVLLAGNREVTEQTRYNVELMYIQDGRLAGERTAVGTTCPNCGAPVTALGAMYCEYCGSAVTPVNLKVWAVHSFDEVDYRHP